ncbi:MAG: glycosyltransferase family 4 protein [Methylomonas sp.]|nr:glycosyltransferase family 4 protein [Methylomonas sp.]PPD20513.1 MAG: glycosyltransferase WbuB [Methylomonas sp.]PPD26808.1 MAG: glycosyltransferase WbuB [Methylomonas sp.]PPD38672.1 MAG: glycosyltransferase WbuB [Methylomonas sp.]PPD40805.1 MAG: glycosyltransferase WbuB [Methylomonas sp.]
MNILFLSHYFPPEVNAPATRTFEHCKQWVKDGHTVTVISCVPHHPMGKAYPGYRNKLYQVEYKEGIKAIKVLTYITANEGFLKRTFNYVFYMVMAIVVAPFVGKADVVISTSPQFFNGLAGYGVARLKRCPWVLEIRDLWPESILAVGAIKNKKVIAVLEWLERFAYRKADHIVPVTHAFQKHIEAHGGHADKITVIRNGVDLTFFVEQAIDERFAEELGVKGKFVAAYVGTHGMAHGLDVILDAAEILRTREDVVFLTAGDGAERARLQAELERRALPNVLMLGQLPKERMPALWSITGVSLVLLKKLDLFLTVIPSKIFETMAMKKPIILGVRGESQMIVEQAGSGVCIEPENAAELAAAVLALADSPERCRALGEAGAVCVAAEFDRTMLAQRFEAVLQRVAG